MAVMLSRRQVLVVALALVGAALVLGAALTRPVAWAKSPAAGKSRTLAVNPSSTGQARTGTSGSPSSGKAPTASLPAATAVRADSDAFFADYKMQRDRALSLETSLLRDVINNPLTTAQARQKAQDQLLSLSREEALLVELEGLAHAEGYADAAVFFENQGVTVVVGPGHGSGVSAARLAQVLARQAGVPPANVVIIYRP